ncbi:hypothetical protein [Marinagarivorans algicola]
MNTTPTTQQVIAVKMILPVPVIIQSITPTMPQTASLPTAKMAALAEATATTP